MAFNYDGFGAFLECECDGEYIIVYRNSGEVRKYPTSIKTILPRQCIPFVGHNIMWYMENAEHTMFFVGRTDGSINGYDIKDNLLRRISNWKPPKGVTCRDIGSCFDVVNHRLVQDLSDNRTCYILGTEDEFIFNEEFVDFVNVPAAVAAGIRREQGIHIMRLNGEEVVAANEGRWIISNSSGWGNKKKLL